MVNLNIEDKKESNNEKSKINITKTTNKNSNEKKREFVLVNNSNLFPKDFFVDEIFKRNIKSSENIQRTKQKKDGFYSQNNNKTSNSSLIGLFGMKNKLKNRAFSQSGSRSTKLVDKLDNFHKHKQMKNSNEEENINYWNKEDCNSADKNRDKKYIESKAKNIIKERLTSGIMTIMEEDEEKNNKTLYDSQKKFYDPNAKEKIKPNTSKGFLTRTEKDIFLLSQKKDEENKDKKTNDDEIVKNMDCENNHLDEAKTMGVADNNINDKQGDNTHTFEFPLLKNNPKFSKSKKPLITGFESKIIYNQQNNRNNNFRTSNLGSIKHNNQGNQGEFENSHHHISQQNSSNWKNTGNLIHYDLINKFTQNNEIIDKKTNIANNYLLKVIDDNKENKLVLNNHKIEKDEFRMNMKNIAKQQLKIMPYNNQLNQQQLKLINNNNSSSNNQINNTQNFNFGNLNEYIKNQEKEKLLIAGRKLNKENETNNNNTFNNKNNFLGNQFHLGRKIPNTREGQSRKLFENANNNNCNFIKGNKKDLNAKTDFFTENHLNSNFSDLQNNYFNLKLDSSNKPECQSSRGLRSTSKEKNYLFANKANKNIFLLPAINLNNNTKTKV